VVLGCTHFPLLQGAIEAEAWRHERGAFGDRGQRVGDGAMRWRSSWPIGGRFAVGERELELLGTDMPEELLGGRGAACLGGARWSR